ncbi:MAG: efflux RND transporter permease subunit, partial [bacterium]
ERVTSTSMENISFIAVTIESDVENMDDVKSEIREAVGRVTDFPEAVTETPLITDIKTAIFPILEVGISGNLPYREMRGLARRFEKKLKEVPGVSRVQKYGYLAREISVEVSPQKLNDYQIPIRQIIAAIQARNIRATGGSLESYTSEKNVVTLAQFRNPLEVGDVLVRTTFEGPAIKVKDLAVIRDDFEDERILTRMNGKAAISFVIEKSETADIIRTAEAIKTLVANEQENLPKGVEFLFTKDVAKNIRKQFDIVRLNGLLGLVLVLVVLTLFLNLRTAFWVAMGIPLTVLGVIFLLPFFDVDLDSITLGAMIIVIGIIVDDAIIISENIYHRREIGDLPIDAAVNGISEVFRPVVTTVLTTFLAFAPMFLMPGMLGKFVFVIPLTIGLALFVSLAEAVVALPAHLIPGLKKKSGGKGESPKKNWFVSVRNVFEKLLLRVLKLRYGVLLLSILVLAGSLFYAANYMNFILFPSSGAEEFLAQIELPVGTSLQATSDKIRQVEELVDGLPEGEVSSYGVRIGAYVDLVDTESENYATLMVNLTPYGTRSRTADEIVEELRVKASQLDGFRSVTFNINAGGPPVGKPVTIRIVGSEDAMRAHLADSVVAFLNTINGVKDIERDDKLGKEQVEIKLDYDKLGRLGLTVADIAQNVRIAYDGQVVTNVRYGEDDVDFRVILEKNARRRLSYLRQLPIPNRQGRLIPLNEVAYLQISPGPANFHHYDGERSLTVTADILQDVTTALNVMQSVLDHFDLHRDFPGMRFVVGGEAQESQESITGLISAFIIAIIGIYFLLILLFNSITQPLMVMIAIPFGIVGVIIAFALHGETLSFLAMTGTLGLVGVVVNDSLVLVNYVNELRSSARDEDLKKTVARGTADRLRAIILTTLSTVAGLLPLAYGIGGTDVYMLPMALALGYGLLFSTPLTLFLIPSLYVIGNDLSRIFKRNPKPAAA